MSRWVRNGLWIVGAAAVICGLSICSAYAAQDASDVPDVRSGQGQPCGSDADCATGLSCFQTGPPQYINYCTAGAMHAYPNGGSGGGGGAPRRLATPRRIVAPAIGTAAAAFAGTQGRNPATRTPIATVVGSALLAATGTPVCRRNLDVAIRVPTEVDRARQTSPQRGGNSLDSKDFRASSSLADSARYRIGRCDCLARYIRTRRDGSHRLNLLLPIPVCRSGADVRRDGEFWRFSTNPVS